MEVSRIVNRLAKIKNYWISSSRCPLSVNKITSKLGKQQAYSVISVTDIRLENKMSKLSFMELTKTVGCPALHLQHFCVVLNILVLEFYLLEICCKYECRSKLSLPIERCSSYHQDFSQE